MKTIGGQGKKQVEAVEVLKPITQKLRIKDAIPENTLSEEAKNELNKIKDRKNGEQRRIIKTNKYAYNFPIFGTIRTFVGDIYNGTVTEKEADGNQSYLLVEILNFQKQVKPKSTGKNSKKMFLKSYIIFFLMLLIATYYYLKQKAQYFQARSWTILISKY